MKYSDKIILAVFFVSTIWSCGNNKMSPLQYNEKNVEIYDNTWLYLLSRKEMLYNHKLSNHEDANAIVEDMNLRLASVIKELDSLDYPCQAVKFHKATISFYKYMKDSMLLLYQELLTYKTNSMEWYDMWDKIDHIYKTKVSDLENDIIEEQKKFAKKVSIMY